MTSFLPTLPFPTPTVLLACIVVAWGLIYLPFTVVAYGRMQIGTQAIATPRAFFDKLPPFAQRATWAHQNTLEAFPIFAAAALMAYVTGQQSEQASWAAIAFVTARLLYPLFYILNIPVGRSLMFGIGSFSIATLFWLSLTQRV